MSSSFESLSPTNKHTKKAHANCNLIRVTIHMSSFVRLPTDRFSQDSVPYLCYSAGESKPWRSNTISPDSIHCDAPFRAYLGRLRASLTVRARRVSRRIRLALICFNQIHIITNTKKINSAKNPIQWDLNPHGQFCIESVHKPRHC